MASKRITLLNFINHIYFISIKALYINNIFIIRRNLSPFYRINVLPYYIWGGKIMGTIIHKMKKGHLYYYYAESARVNGKPRIVKQKYLGRAENICDAIDSLKKCEDLQPKYSIIKDFGAVCALFELSKQLGVIDCIDKYAHKRDQGLSVGQYILLTAINRALCPASKSKFAAWYDDTVLTKLIPVQKSFLSPQSFWNNMDLLSELAIKQFEDEFCTMIVKKYGLSTDCLIYDTTNFFTFVDTNSSSKLPQRGHCKSKRTDLKIVGLAMMVSPDFNIPLFHETYAGNTTDPVEFGQIIDNLKKRMTQISAKPDMITLVFDKGNNSLGNMEKIYDEQKKRGDFKVVGSLKFCEHKDLLAIPQNCFTVVPDYEGRGIKAFRCTRMVYNREMTVIISYNPELFKGQMQGINHNIEKSILDLKKLKERLVNRANGKISKGKKPTVKSVKKNIKDILQREYMKHIFSTEVTAVNGVIDFEFSVSSEKLEYIKEKYLGKNLLFTDNNDWSTGKIISAYRSQYHIEDAFRQMKDTTFLGFRPIRHWTDQKIMVHAFYCVLALRLCYILNRTFHENGLKISINRMLEMLVDIKQVITIYPKRGDSKKDREVYSLSKIETEQKKALGFLNIEQYIMGG